MSLLYDSFTSFLNAFSSAYLYLLVFTKVKESKLLILMATDADASTVHCHHNEALFSIIVSWVECCSTIEYS